MPFLNRRRHAAILLIIGTSPLLLSACGAGVAGKVESATGNSNLSCSFTGRMLLGGLSEKVYRCTDDSGDAPTACYAVHGSEVADVSKQFQTLIKLQGKSVDCGFA